MPKDTLPSISPAVHPKPEPKKSGSVERIKADARRRCALARRVERAIEAVRVELARDPDPELDEAIERLIAVIQTAALKPVVAPVAEAAE